MKNCFASGNVVGGAAGAGGLIGLAQYTFIMNSYATGSVYNTRSSGDNFTGGLVGWLKYGGRITNSYATGYVDGNAATGHLGGFIGHLDGLAAAYPLYISDCRYDQTTTAATRGTGSRGSGGSYLHITEAGAAADDVSGLRTSAMITSATYAGWTITDNVCVVPASRHTGTPEHPWYIDEGVTYPYLWYQADGFTSERKEMQEKPDRLDESAIGSGMLGDQVVDAKARNYYILELEQRTGLNESYTAVPGPLVDYSPAVLHALQVQYQAVSAGAAGVYFPWLHGSSRTDYNEYRYWFGSDAKVQLPADQLYDHDAAALYSLGAISATQIIAFMDGSYVEELVLEFRKISNAWYHGDSTYAEVLAGAGFTLYWWAGTGEPGADELVAKADDAQGPWIKQAEAISDEAGAVHLPLAAGAGIYQLVETHAPDGYQLPSGQWRLYQQEGDSIATIIQSITAIRGADGTLPPAFKVIDEDELNGAFEGELALVNFKRYELPLTGGFGIIRFLAPGTWLLLAGIAMGAVYKGEQIRRQTK